jgi:hypothetical protein
LKGKNEMREFSGDNAEMLLVMMVFEKVVKSRRYQIWKAIECQLLLFSQLAITPRW